MNLPKGEWARWLPKGHQAFTEKGEHPTTGFMAHELKDGTKVILVTHESYETVELAVASALSR